jgi:hypothetical protein
MITLKQFIQQFFPAYQINADNEELITKLGLWAMRDPEFENPKMGIYLDKGIFLSGNVGSGKTKVMKLLGSYLSFLHSPYLYEMKYVWKFAEAYKDVAFGCFKAEFSGNRYYDELALTNEITKMPEREMVHHFGTKILIGQELIFVRYEAFVNNGYITCFTSNEPPSRMKEIYGTRADDRLAEMCNFFSLNSATSWRRIIQPVPIRNVNIGLAPNQVLRDDIAENKIRLNLQYKNYCETGKIDVMQQFDYTLFTVYGQEPLTETELQLLMDSIHAERKIEIEKKLEYKSNRDYSESKRLKQLKDQYELGKYDQEEKNLVFGRARITAIQTFYEKMKAAGKDKIFEDV